MSTYGPSSKRGREEVIKDMLSSNEPSAKKSKFDVRNPSTLAADADDDDPVLDADEVQQARFLKRGAVKIDGYDSDSSNEGFNARAEAKSKANKKAAKEDEDSDDDMFAVKKDDIEDGDQDGEERIKKKEVRFLQGQEIEGQEGESKSGGRIEVDFARESESDSDSGGEEGRAALDSDVDEEVGAGGKRKHAPKIDAFNMKGELEEGGFDQSGNFVRKAADPNAQHDLWLEGISNKEMKRAAEAQAKQDADRKRRDREDDAIMSADLLASLIKELNKGENSFEALARLQAAAPKPKRKPTKHAWGKKKENSMDVEQVEEDPAATEAEKTRKAAIEAITEAATKLMGRGDNDIYDHEREMLIRKWQNETDEQWKDPEPQYQFRYAGVDETNGPYSKETISEWIKEDAFAGHDVEYAQIGKEGWYPLESFTEYED